MHEVSLVQALFDQADQAIVPHPSRCVRQLTVRIGKLAGVESELFCTAFEGCKAERGYASAVLEVVEEDVAWSCSACGAAVAPGGPLQCGSCPGQARLSAGGDLILQRLELEVADV
jgi:Zn finger protein HypA/HybF involved in hydrogenase expression